ncbi:614/534 cytochrome P450 [Rhizoctonia solani]|nr:614/534 cytochrome P450 [Rhizoctonia solani]
MSLPRLLFQCSLGYLLVFVVFKWHQLRRALAQIGYHPGSRTLFGFSPVLGNILPYIPYISLGRDHWWRTKYQVFKKLGSEIYGGVSVFPTGSHFMLADSAAVKRVSYTHNSFVKNTEYYKIAKEFGSNLLVVEGEEWKRQRRIAAPAFSDKNNRLVWDTAKGFVEQGINTWETNKPTIIHDVRKDFTSQLSLCIIAKAAFGQDISVGNDAITTGHKLSFRDALLTASKSLHLPLILPSWAWKLREGWSQAKQAHDELRLYLREMIAARRELKQQQIQELLDRKYDLFNQLIYARDVDDMLTEDELIGNVFLFLLGGHETSASTFAIILSLLALYPEVQNKLVKQLQQLEHEHGALNYGHFHLLTYAMAVVYETLRLFPLVGLLPKKATADTTVTVGFPPHTRTIQVPASTMVNISPIGLHYSPNYWESPEDFDPERFMDPHWNRDAFIPFSLGPRACIGRRFAETALVAQIATFITKYEVSIDESRFKFIEGESILERRTRLINPQVQLALSPAPISLVFSLRDPN